MNRSRTTLIAAAVITSAVAACGGTADESAVEDAVTATTAPAAIPSTAAATDDPPTSTTGVQPVRFVAFGDSWVQGDHCGGCRTFAPLWADAIEVQTGRVVEFTDLTGPSEGSSGSGKSSATLLESLRANERARTAAADADVILIATGPNEIDPALDALGTGTCGGPDELDCVRSVGDLWSENFEAILTEIESLRSGRPAVIRLVNAVDLLVAEPDLRQFFPDSAVPATALLFELLTTAMCDAAAAHGAVCVDVRPVLAGPNLDQAVDENSPETMQAVADALTATGLEELSGVAGASVPAPADRSIPEGVYRTDPVDAERMRAAVIAAGFDEDFVAGNFYADVAPIVVGLRIADGGWTQLYSAGGAPEEVGWRGSYELVDADTVIATDPECSITYTYAFDGEQLTLDVVDASCGTLDLMIQTGLFETAPFVLVEPASTEAPTATHSYATDEFVVPFEVTLPAWLPAEPSTASPTFITWESLQVDRAIRLLAPVNLYPPESATATPVPDDYMSYLLGLADYGAELSDIVRTTVDGHAATVLTVASSTGLNGSLGCPEGAVRADDDCFGAQPEFVLRLAVIDTGPHTVLIWVRDNAGDGQRQHEYDTFDALLESIRFR